jgi:hypothetical protein
LSKSKRQPEGIVTRQVSEKKRRRRRRREGPELPREKFMMGTTHFTYDQFAQKWPRALTPEYLAQMGPMISKPGQLGYVLVREGQTLGSPEGWNQPQWYPKGFVETKYEAAEAH